MFHKLEILKNEDPEIVTVLFFYGSCNLVGAVVNLSLFMSLITKHKFLIQLLNIIGLTIGMCAKLIGFEEAWKIKGKLLWPTAFLLIALAIYLYIYEKLNAVNKEEMLEVERMF